MGFFQAAVEVGVLYVAVFAAFEYVFWGKSLLLQR